MATITLSPNPVPVDQGVDVRIWTTAPTAARCVVECSGANWGNYDATLWSTYWYVAPRFSQPGTTTVRVTFYDSAGNVLDTGSAQLEVRAS
jgi:hypothetical protein